MPYAFPTPRPRGFQPDGSSSERKCEREPVFDGPDFEVNDLVLHALIGRVTANNNHVHEFETLFDKDQKSIEIDVPSCFLDYLETIAVGPNICRYMRWLVCAAFGGLADNLYWASLDELTEIITNKRYSTPHKFFPNTLAVFLNGKKVDRNAANGFTVIDDHTFELKETYDCSMKVSVGYMKNGL